MKFALFTAARYLKSRKDNAFISKLILISVVTVTLAIMLPIIILSVVNGFHASVGDKILSFDFHINIKDRYNNFSSHKDILKEMEANRYVKLATPFFQSQGFIKSIYDDTIYFVTIKAMHNKDFSKNPLFTKNFIIKKATRLIFKDGIIQSTPLKKHEERNFAVKGSEIIIGNVLSNILGVFKGDKIKLFIPQGDIQLDRKASSIKTFKVSDLYSAGYARFDKGIVFISFDAISKVFSFDAIPSDIGILLKDKSYISNFVLYLRDRYPKLTISSTISEGIFKDFEREKRLMFVILFLLVLSSFVTMYISIHVVVIDKQKEIGILKAIGVTRSTVERIFIVEGFLISFTGVFLGSFLGVFITISLTDIIRFIEYTVNFIKLLFFNYFGEFFKLDYPYPFYIMDPNIFYLDSFPYRIYYEDIVTLSIGAILVSLLAAYFPAKKASKEKVASTILR